MSASRRRKTVFGADDELLTEFQVQLKRQKLEMSEVIEGWIRDYIDSKRTLPHAPMPTNGTCPVCESEFSMTPEGATLTKTGPIEPFTPGTVPDELMPLVLNFLDSYLSDPIFAQTVNGIIKIHRSVKK